MPNISTEIRVCSSCEFFRPAYPTAPVRHSTWTARPWEGGWRRTPWNYRVTVAIPVLDATEAVSVIVELLRLQTEPPFIMLIDTGSSAEQLAGLQQLAAEDVEVHSLRFNGVRHPSDFPAVAMDLAFSAARTPYLLATHADCFLTSRTVVQDLLALCNAATPVVGYEITPRPHSDWRGMVGHTLTLFHVATMDNINASWSLRRLITQYAHPDGAPAAQGIDPATNPNWPDTELLVNYQCRAAGIVPKIIGHEANAARTMDERIDHCRSFISAQLYASRSQYAGDASGWLADGLSKARERITLWTQEKQGQLR